MPRSFYIDARKLRSLCDIVNVFLHEETYIDKGVLHIIQMRLTLKNFRYHREETFDLPDEGLTLICGERGSGKSTLLNAVFFALYGKIRRPYSHGANSCSVELEDKKKKIVIKRSCRPNRLVVNYDGTEFEDDGAQGAIEKIYGMNMEEFQFSSYFDQKKHSSILSMTPSEQLHFIELIAFANSDHEDIKEQIRVNSKELEKQQTEIAAQIRLLEAQLETREAEMESAIALPDDFDVEAVRRQHEEATSSMKQIKKQLDSKREILKALRAEEETRREEEQVQKKLEIEMNHYSSQRSALGECLEEDQIEEIRVKSEEARNIVDALESLNEASQLQEEYDTMLAEHKSDVETKISEIESKLLSEEEVSDANAQIESYEEMRRIREEQEREHAEKVKAKEEASGAVAVAKKNILSMKPPKNIKTVPALKKFAMKKIEELAVNVDDLEHKLEIIECGNLSCPKCEASLTFGDDGLIEREDIGDVDENDVPEIEMQVASIKANLEILQNAVESIDKYSEIANAKIPVSKKTKLMSLADFQDLSVRVSEQSDLRREIEVLKGQDLPKHLKTLARKIKSKKSNIPDDIDASMDIDEAKAVAKKLEDDVDEAWRTRGTYTSLTREIETRRKQLGRSKKKFLKANKKTVTPSDVEAEIHNIEFEMTSCTDTIEQLQDKLRLVEIYDARERSKNEIKKLQRTLSEKKEESSNIDQRLKGSYGLEKAAIDAEFYALEKTIGSINEYARIYLEQMFEDDISAKLTVKKFTKKGDIAARPSINIKVLYNGAVYDDIDDLSGGERQQCDLAFLLAVNDMLGSNMILLDECLNNLNAEINMSTLTFLRDFCGDKQVLVVSHEAVTGVFDHEVRLERK